MKLAIIYSTSSRTTKKACKILSSKIKCEVQLIPIEKAKSACLLKYNFIILAGSAYNGKVQSAMKRYISRNMKTLKEKPIALVMNCEENAMRSRLRRKRRRSCWMLASRNSAINWLKMLSDLPRS